MVVAHSSSDLFSRVVNPARAKIVILGSAEILPEYTQNQIRSLHIEHVSSATLMRQEICRRKLSARKGEEAVLVAYRRWFWTRKPDAGFLLKDFPATMLQALVFDEWLEARTEALDAVVAADNAPAELLEYYRNRGLLLETTHVYAP